jgi:hypothetical protein
MTGAGGAISRTDFTRMDDHAERYYEEIRNRTADIAAIARNTGFNKKDICLIKKHIFFNEYDLGKKSLTRFDPDYDMAVSWQRLIDGKNIQEMDIILLYHELEEYKLMNIQKLRYGEAHELAESKYNYSRFIIELNRKAGIQ